MNVYCYEYNKENDFILPYIIAPLGAMQDTVILGSNYITAKQEDFISEIDSATIDINTIGARVANYNDFLNVYITFATDCEEIGSQRKGLNLTVGALIHKEIFAKKVHICKFYMQFLINKFNEVFNMDLYKDGAKQFISLTSKNENNFKPYLEKFYDVSKKFESIFYWKIRKHIFCRRIFKQSNKMQFPTVIFTENKQEKDTQLDTIIFFFEIVDKHIKGVQNIDVSTFKDKGELVDIKPYLSINGKINKVVNISNKDKQYIEIYIK
jgi:hypothetical protein